MSEQDKVQGRTPTGRIQASSSGQETRQPKELTEFIFTQTVELMWMQATALFGENADKVICDAVKSGNPSDHLQNYLPNALSTAQ